MFCYLFYYTGRQAFGFAMPGIQQELGLDKRALGWISAGLMWSYALGQAINGNLGDKLGGRRMVSLGALLSCAMCWVMSFGSSFTSLLVAWSINGFVQSMGWAPGSRVISNWWGHSERGRAYGFYTLAAGGSSILTYLTSTLVIVVLGLGWRWIFRLPVLLMVIGGVAYYFIVRDRPEDLGFTQPGDSGKGKQEPAESSINRYLGVVSNWRFGVASLSIGFQSVARYGLLVWVPVHFLGKDNPAAKWISIALPVGMAMGAMCNGWLSDRFFREARSRGIAIFMVLAAVSAAAMYLLPLGTTGGIVLLFLCGFFTYGPQSAFWALCPDLLGSQRAGTGTGVMDMCAYVFAGLGGPFIGWMIQSHGDQTALIFPVVAASCLLSAVVALFIRR